ncbi:hypothetical protein VNO77_00909 [Canavalia gladiata]|uniref:Uncharacterized protein n=1 Tax=Canavalia gladiata TaxID=3824 RepID=A0AAN9MQY9_CANGL
MVGSKGSKYVRFVVLICREKFRKDTRNWIASGSNLNLICYSFKCKSDTVFVQLPTPKVVFNHNIDTLLIADKRISDESKKGFGNDIDGTFNLMSIIVKWTVIGVMDIYALLSHDDAGR